jgi:hypothetical protein
MRHFLRWGLAGALLLLTPGAALAAKTPPKVTPTPKAAKTAPKATSTPMATPSISGHITYVGANGNIFVARPDGTDKRALTNNSPTDPAYNAPLSSPKGDGILAVRFAAGLAAFKGSDTAGLWLVSQAGARRLSPNVSRGYAWTADGARIVYEEGYLSETSLTVLDPRTGQKHTLACDPAFRLIGVTDVGNRAIGVQGHDIVAESLTDGTTQGLTNYGAKAGVWQGVAAVSPSGRAVLYAEAPGTTLVSIDLRGGHVTRTSLASAASGVAPSTDASMYVYAMSGTGNTMQTALHTGKGVTSLRGDVSFTAHAFAPNGAAFVYSIGGNLPYVFVAPVSCAATCATRLDFGRDAAWSP